MTKIQRNSDKDEHVVLMDSTHYNKIMELLDVKNAQEVW